MPVRSTQEKPPEPDYLTRQLIGDLWIMLKPHRARFFLASVTRVTGDLAMLYPAYAIASIATFFSRWQLGESTAPFWTIVGLMVGAALIRQVGFFFAKQIGFQVGEKVALDAQMSALRHLSRLDIAWHEQENAGNKMKRIQRGGEGIDRIFRIWFINMLEIGVSVIGILVLLSAFDVRISAAMLFFVLTFYAMSRPLTRLASEASIAVNLKEEEMTGLMFESINNIRSAKVLGMTESLLAIVCKGAADLFAKIRLRIFRFQSRGLALSLWARLFGISGIAIIGYGIMRSRYEIGFLLLFWGYFGRIWESLNELSDSTQELIIARHSVGRMMQLLDVPVLIDDETGKVDFPIDWQVIAIQNLSFSYAGRKVLKNLSFEIKRGERLGIVGLSGAANRRCSNSC